MNLTTIARVKTWSPTSTSSTQFDGLLRGQIAAVSAKLEEYINRHVAVEQFTEDYYADQLATRFFLRAAPIYTTTATKQRANGGCGSTILVATAPALTFSPTRDFSGQAAEDALTYYFRNADGQVEFDFPINYTGYRNPGAFRAAYYGGMAYTLDQLTCSSTSHVGTPLVAGYAVTGSLSGAKGVVLAITSDVSISVQVLSGAFQVGESFVYDSDATRYAAFTAWGDTGAPLCMAYPELVEAANMQVSSWFQRREQMSITSMSVEGTTISMEKTGTLLKGVQETVAHLVRYGTSY